MKVFMIVISVVLFTASVFLIAKYGTKKKESEDFINADKHFDL